MSRGKPERRPELLNDEDHSIISRYGAEYRGIVQYYLLAGDVHRLDRLHWVMVTSLLKTLAAKYDSSVSKMARKYGATIETPHGPRRAIQVSVDRGEGRKPLVATFGGIPLRRQKNAILRDRESVPATPRRTELVPELGWSGADLQHPEVPSVRTRKPGRQRRELQVFGCSHAALARKPVARPYERTSHVVPQHRTTLSQPSGGSVIPERLVIVGDHRDRQML